MPAFPAFKTKPYYSELSNFLAVSIDLATGELLDSAVRPVVVSELADNQTVVDAAAAAVPDALAATDFGPYVGPEVDAHIAADPNFTAAAETAVDTEVAGRNIPELQAVEVEDIAYGVLFEDGKRSWLEMNYNGAPTTWAAELIAATMPSLASHIVKITPSMTTAEIQAVLDSVAASGGGTVVATPGEYTITATLELPYRVHLVSDGWAQYASAQLYGQHVNDVTFWGGPTLTTPILTEKNDGPVVFTSYRQQNSLVAGIAFNGANMPSGMAVTDGLVKFTSMQAVWITGCNFSESPGSGLVAQRTIGMMTTDCAMNNNAGAGIYYYADADDNFVSGCGIGNNGACGIQAIGGSYLILTGNKIFNNGGAAGLYISGAGTTTSAVHNVVTGNAFDDNGGDGVYFAGVWHSLLTGNTAARNEGAGIRLGVGTGPSSYNTVTGCQSAGQTGAAKVQDYGFRVDANCDYNVFSGNLANENSVANWLIDPTGTSNNRYGMEMGATAAATTLGTLTNRIEVFDRNGVSMGYIPVYDTIT